MDKIYLDHAATTPVDQKVVEAMLPYFTADFGNASSIHSFGQKAREAVDQSRRTVAKFLNCEPQEVIFTSGGTESDNLAIRGLMAAGQKSRSSEVQKSKEKTIGLSDFQTPHVITTQIEHHAVLNTVKELEKSGLIEATYIKPNSEGIISVDNIKSAIKPNTVLVSVMYVNNEIGTVQPIREIGKMIEKENQTRKQRIYFHTDAVQAAEYFEMNVAALHVDLLTFTAHKIYGPKGVGVLYVKKGTPLKSQLVGGDQEYRKRAGTENVPGIVGLAKAVEIIFARHPESVEGSSEASTRPSSLDSSADRARIQNDIILLRDKLINGILSSVKDSQLNGSRELRSPGNVNISVKNAEGEAVLLNLDLLDIAASSGSACTSGALEPSHVLLAIGVPVEISHGSIRFTLGRHTTEEEIDRVLEVFPKIVEKVRSISPFK
jgi:cysteine desulfurase